MDTVLCQYKCHLCMCEYLLEVILVAENNVVCDL